MSARGGFQLPSFYSYPPYFTCVASARSSQHTWTALRAVLSAVPYPSSASFSSSPRSTMRWQPWVDTLPSRLCLIQMCACITTWGWRSIWGGEHLGRGAGLDLEPKPVEVFEMPGKTRCHSPQPLISSENTEMLRPCCRLQPVKESREKQIGLWHDLLLGYCRYHRARRALPAFIPFSYILPPPPTRSISSCCGLLPGPS